jgi:hypothetical protein
MWMKIGGLRILLLRFVSFVSFVALVALVSVVSLCELVHYKRESIGVMSAFPQWFFDYARDYSALEFAHGFLVHWSCEITRLG